MATMGLAVLTGCDSPVGGSATEVDHLPTLTAAEDLRIGSRDDPDLGFSRVLNLDVDDEGNLYVAEYLDREIRVYDREGGFLRRFGGNGEGPGEFLSLMWLGVVGDTVWALDPRQRRTTWFDRRGALLSTGNWESVPVSHPSAGNAGFVVPLLRRTDGLFQGEMSIQTASLASDPDAPGARDSLRVPRVLFDASGAVVDTVGWDVRPPPGQGSIERLQIGSTRFSVPKPPTDGTLQISQAHGRWIVNRPLAQSADVSTFSITRLGLDGDTLFVREYRYAPKRYPDGLLDSLATRAASPRRSDPDVDVDAVRRRLRGLMEFPEFQPPVLAGLGGADGTLWVRREDMGSSSFSWLVIGPDGSPQGHIYVPRGSSIKWVGEGEFVVVEPDEFNVPWVVRFRFDG